MNIGLVTIAFNGYGRFVDQFLGFVLEMNPKPTQLVIVLGKNHGCEIEDIDNIELLIDIPTTVVHYEKKASFGKLRNIGVKHLNTEWAWFVSIDDKPMPDAIQTFSKYKDYDYICSQWYTTGLTKDTTRHKSPTPYEYYQHKKGGKKGGFIIAHSPFKKWLWDKVPYEDHDYPNSPFVLGCVESGAKFVKSDTPTTTYLRRPDSHARTILIKPNEKRLAIKHKKRMEVGFYRYYERNK